MNNETKKQHLEVEVKYDGSSIDRIAFKTLVSSFNPDYFLYVESTDVYYLKSDDDFLRYRMPAISDTTGRSEICFKKKRSTGNNLVRTEVNVRIDNNSADTIDAFITGLGYSRNFSIYKLCDIYSCGKEAFLVFYTVIDENGKAASFIEIEAMEDLNLPEEEAWAIVQKYEKMLAPLGISPQKRMKLSLFERYRKDLK